MGPRYLLALRPLIANSPAALGSNHLCAFFLTSKLMCVDPPRAPARPDDGQHKHGDSTVGGVRGANFGVMGMFDISCFLEPKEGDL